MADKRLLLVSCSKTKRPDECPLPAIERYDGPAFRVLRRYTNHCPAQAKHLDVWVLSAAHGLIAGTKLIEYYDVQMTGQRVAEMKEGVSRDLGTLGLEQYTSVCVAMSATYASTLGPLDEIVPIKDRLTMAGGSQGCRLTRLKQWLWGAHYFDQPRSTKPTLQPGVNRTIQLNGKKISLNNNDVMEFARSALAEDAKGHTLFSSWYVNIDGVNVGAKWLVSRLVELPVSQFSTTDAVRILRRAGVAIDRKVSIL